MDRVVIHKVQRLLPNYTSVVWAQESFLSGCSRYEALGSERVNRFRSCLTSLCFTKFGCQCSKLRLECIDLSAFLILELLIANINLELVQLLSLPSKGILLLPIHLFLEVDHVLLEHLKLLADLISFLGNILDLSLSLNKR